MQVRVEIPDLAAGFTSIQYLAATLLVIMVCKSEICSLATALSVSFDYLCESRKDKLDQASYTCCWFWCIYLFIALIRDSALRLSLRTGAPLRYVLRKDKIKR